MFAHTLTKYGITAQFVEPDDLSGYEAKINDKTRAIYIESIGNPSGNIVDVEDLIADLEQSFERI